MPSARSVATVAALALAAGGLTLLPGAAPQAAADSLVPYAGCDELLAHYRSELVRNATAYGSGMRFYNSSGMALESTAAAGSDGGSAAGDAVGSGPTGTNVQERGVDEPDSAKLAGGLLFTFSEQALQILRAGAQPELLSRFPLDGPSYGAELLVQDDRVLVLMPSGEMGIYRDGGAIAASMPGAAVGTRLLLIDVADPEQPRLLETLELDGRYLSARLSGGAVRLVTASTPRIEPAPINEPYGPAQEQEALTINRERADSATVDQVLPQAVRTGPEGESISSGPAVACDQVRHTSEPQGVSTLLVTTLDLTEDLAAQDSTGVTTDGELVYASADRLYVATSRWGMSPAVSSSEDVAIAPARSADVTTELHAFDTASPTDTRYAGSTSVAGFVYGRWALSSHEGHLRVATTSSPPWEQQGQQQSSSVTVLEERSDGLVETGRVDGLGPDEQIYAVRYLGDLATVVTFRQTDPLYVLDLGDPSDPRLLGELKVPGFSTYLHPVGGDRLLGLGQEATAEGQVTGMQISLFDLSDLSKPVQLDRLPLGQAYSPASTDSRAFGYDPERRMALFPLGSYDGRTETQEAVAVRVTPEGSLNEVGRLAMDASWPVNRVLHDDTHVYAVTFAGLVAANGDDLRRTGSVAFG